jgi:predicted phage terminase large subunit-like protein
MTFEPLRRRIERLEQTMLPRPRGTIPELPSLYAFTREAWAVLEPATPFVDGWHIEAICDHLEAVTSGQIKRLLINIPPRHMKSTLVSVMWPVWAWLSEPSTRWLCASYALSLAIRDNRKCRLLIQSPWFQARYGELFHLSSDQNAKSSFENDRRGYRLAVSVGSAATGQGGDLLIGDDLHAIDEKESDAARESALDWFDTTFSTRLNSEHGAIVVVGQRIHEQDISGHILEQGGWEHLCLPAEFDPQRRCHTPTLDWSDPRRDEGELLWKHRFSRETLENQKRNLGVLGYSALYGQRPVPPGGYIFNQSYERLFTLSPEGDAYLLITPGGVKSVLVTRCQLLTTSDVAVKEKESAAYTVFATWAITPDHDVLLLDVVRDHWSIPKQKEQGRQVYRTWVCDRYTALYFEDVGYQSAIGQDLLVEGIPCLPFYPTGDKVQRAGGAAIWMEAGKVYFKKGAPWLEDWRNEIYHFPKWAHADQVDTLSMVCMIVRAPGDIEPLDAETVDLLLNYRGY